MVVKSPTPQTSRRLFCGGLGQRHISESISASPSILKLVCSMALTLLLGTSGAWSQEIRKHQAIRAFETGTDSIVVYKVSDVVYDNLFRFIRVRKFYKHESLASAEVISVMHGNEYEETFYTSGIYGFQCFDNGIALKPTFLHVDDRYVASVHKVLRVGHPKHYYYYIQ